MGLVISDAPMLELVAKITHYEQQQGAHASGSVEPAVLQQIVRLAPPAPSFSIETGCGKTTVLFSQLSRRHVAFTVDDRAEKGGSLPFVESCPLLRRAAVEFVLGPSQVTLPRYPMPPSIDVALIDGPHAYPFPDLEYFYIYPHLRPGALLIIDDIHIATIARMYDILREDAMFDPIHVEQNTAFLRRTDAPVLPKPTWDGWNLQRYNVSRLR